MASLRIPVQMRFGDIDSYGHINNVIQLQYFEDARVRLSETPVQDVTGTASQRTYRDLVGQRLTVIGRQEVEYLAQLHYRLEPIEVEVWASHLGMSSYVLNYRLQEPDGTRLYTIAQSTTVEIDRTTGRPVPLDEQQRQFLEHVRQAPVVFSRRPAEPVEPAEPAGLVPGAGRGGQGGA